MRKLLYAVTVVGLLAIGLAAQQSGGSFFPAFNYDIAGAWNFSGTIPTLTGNGSVVGTSATQTLTNKTLTSPTIASPTITSPTVTGGTYSAAINSDIKVLAANKTHTSDAALASLTGFSWSVTAAGVYQFEINLPCTMSTNGGLSVAFKYTTATLTSIQAQTYAATASDNTTAVSTQSTTTTDQTKFFDSKTAAYTLVRIHGTLVVNAAGTVAVQTAQNTSHSDTTTVLLGAYARFTRVS